MNLLLIALGGGLGAVARFGIGEWLNTSSDQIPWGTLGVNVVGATALGFLLAGLIGREDSESLRLLFGVGFLGSFTTFSTFSMEIVRMAEHGGWLRGATYAGASIVLGIGGVLLGGWLGGLGRG